MAYILKITVTDGDKQELGREFSASLEEPVLIGRSHSCGIRFQEADVSGRHLEVSESSDGMRLLVLSRHGAELNGVSLSEGEGRPLMAGDVVRLGRRTRFRVDSAGSLKSSSRGSVRTPVEEDGETSAMTRNGATFETRAADNPTFATRVAEPTFATRVVNGTSQSVDTMESTGAEVLVAKSVPLDGESPAVDADQIADDSPTFAGNGEDTTGGLSADGKTQEMRTRAGSMDEINRYKRLMAQKKRVRHSLILAAATIFFCLLGAVVWVRWPKAEMTLTFPKTILGKSDFETHYVDSDGVHAFELMYPRDDRMTKSSSSAGDTYEVSTFIGSKRDVAFRLRMDVTHDKAELGRSLAECAEAIKKADEDSGRATYLNPPGWPEKCCFFENEYPVVCPKPLLMRGTRFWRGEYQAGSGTMKWHGILLIVRDGDTVFSLRREIPESEWPRGSFLLHTDPNIRPLRQFSENRWESPGAVGLVSNESFEVMLNAVNNALAQKEMRNWFETKRRLDAMASMTWRGNTDNRGITQKLLAKFRQKQDAKFAKCKFDYDLAKANGGQPGLSGMKSANEVCRLLFGRDETDRRSEIIGVLEDWTCQQKH